MSQNARLLDHLKSHGSINPMQAWNELGIYRLGARAFDLRKDGYNIISTLVEVPNRFGEVCKVAEYQLVS